MVITWPENARTTFKRSSMLADGIDPCATKRMSGKSFWALEYE
jgi:hypothetical protein